MVNVYWPPPLPTPSPDPYYLSFCLHHLLHHLHLLLHFLCLLLNRLCLLHICEGRGPKAYAFGYK